METSPLAELPDLISSALRESAPRRDWEIVTVKGEIYVLTLKKIGEVK